MADVILIITKTIIFTSVGDIWHYLVLGDTNLVDITAEILHGQ